LIFLFSLKRKKNICSSNHKTKKLKQFFLAFLIYNWGFSQTKSSANFNSSGKVTYTIHHEFQKYFDSCGVDGSIVIFDKNHQNWLVSDAIKIQKESLPASTFKIINLLIALETKTIKNENEIVKWVGSTDTLKYGYRPDIYHDMTVKEAFEISAGWVFIELAEKIGRDNYHKYLSKCKYGNLNLSQKETDFWNFGNFGISPINQVEFIRDLYEGKLPFAKRNIDILKKVMLSEQNDNYNIRAKTGWTRENNTNTGWWLGYLETQGNVYFFASNLIQDRKFKRDDFGDCRKDITKKVFKELKIIL
jgi:beta-lactamase class D